MTAFYYSFNMTWASISITQVLITRINIDYDLVRCEKEHMESAVAVQERWKTKKLSMDRAFRCNYVYTTNPRLHKHCLFVLNSASILIEWMPTWLASCFDNEKISSEAQAFIISDACLESL